MIRERLKKALENRGFNVVEHRSTRFIAMTKDNETFYFIGKSGALRRGRNVTDSRPIENAKQKLLQEVP